MDVFRFTTAVMARALDKRLYNSLEHLSNFLGAEDDALAAAALECLAAVVGPSK